MLLFLISWLSCMYTLPQQADVYYVVHVHGLIINQSKKDTLSVGDKVYPTDKLAFKSLDAKATVLSTKKGRFTIGKAVTNSSSASSTGGEFMALLQNVLINEKSTERLSTRGLEVEKVVDLKSAFGHDRFVFPGSQAKLILDKAAHPMSGEHFFMYRYTYGNNEIARKKIPFKGDTLIFDKKVLYTVKGQIIHPEAVGEVELHKVNAQAKSSMLIARFVPLFVPHEQLKAELEVINTVLKPENLTENALLDTMYGHVTAVYGQTDKNLLKLWINEHLFINK